MSIFLAQKYPNLKCIVQDVSSNDIEFQAILPPHLKSRVTFQTHDFFKPQSTHADIFFLKHILHDWPDFLAISILQNLRPVLQRGNKLVLYEGIIPQHTPQNTNEVTPILRSLGALDLQMLALHNAKERTVEEWRVLVEMADPGFVFRCVHSYPDGQFGLLVWEFLPGGKDDCRESTI